MPDDRDQLFEKALARQLGGDGAAESLCLDPETLAAYHERALSSEEISAAKSHIVSCARCQEILAQLETTEEIADAVSDPGAEPEIVPALATAKPAAPSVREELFVVAASARSATPEKLRSIATKRTFSLRWVVPTGAVAAGLLLLIGLRELRPAAQKAAAESAQVAENPAPVPAPQESEALKATEEDKPQLKQQEERQALRMSAPPGAPMGRSENAVRDEKKDSSSRIPHDDSRAMGLRSPAMARRQDAAGPNVAAGQAQAADAIQQSAPPLNGRATQQVEIAPKAGDVASILSKTPDDSAARTRAKAGVGGGEGAQNGPAAVPAPPAPSTSAGNLQVSVGNERAEVVTRAQVSEVGAYSGVASKIGLDIRIPAPGGIKIWSVGPDGQILYSKDSGHTWLRQTSGVSANLTGGSAPSEKVCWIVGAGGTLLRTTDGGYHWQPISTPITSDLGGVRASDAQHASIWDAPNHLRYQTTDSGATWKPSANE